MMWPMSSRLLQSCLAVTVVMVIAGCRPVEPAPTYNEDLGTDDMVLLPTSPGWHDPAVVNGQADWRPFRKPGTEAKSTETTAVEPKPTVANPEVETELRELVSEFNGLVAEGKFEEATEFLIEEQVAPAKRIVELIPALVGKMKEVSDVLPGDNESLKKAVEVASLPAVLLVKVESITVSSPTEAVGKLASAVGQTGDVRFVLVKEAEGEYWYFDHPQVRAITPTLTSLELSLPHMDAFLADIKTGKVDEKPMAESVATFRRILAGMIPPGPQAGEEPTKDESGEDAKTEGDANPVENARPEEAAEPEEDGGPEEGG